ncbi:hypothetical protein EX30DRAFT_392195 [Ascodesmis nigricans]|uniref:Uncharacterized protein n=1 Tax=Ascodesmis nigricans TaxID=341454 RepID=A0A4S2N6A9_9PEZI|nr:hypothetical protein EX30DRAFT_392195 [Ascodesmis nigricans]
MRAAAALFLAQAALSSAFVVPKLADFSPEDIDVELSLSRVVRIPCTGCPVEEDSDLIFDFNLHGSKPKELSINGMPIVPVDVSKASDLNLKAPIIPKGVSTLEYLTNQDAFKKAEIGYSLMITDSTRMYPIPSTVHSIEINTMTVNHLPVHIEGFAMDVHESLADHTLVLGSGRMVPVSEQCGPNIRCMLSKMMTKLRGVGARLGCGGRPQNGGPPPGYAMPHGGPPHGHAMPHGSHPHHGSERGRFHGNHHHARPYHNAEPSFFSRAFHLVLLPIFVGLVSGLAFGALALVLTHIFISLFRRFTGRAPCFARKSKKCKFSRRQGCRERQEEGNDEEKNGLMAVQAYEDAPVSNEEMPPAYHSEIAEGLEVVEKH